MILINIDIVILIILTLLNHILEHVNILFIGY